MIEKNLKKVNGFLHQWQGSRAEFDHFHTSMGNVFGLALFKEGKSVGVKFATCLIQGPTSWENCNLVCVTWLDKKGLEGFEVKDEAVGFIVRGTGGISAGNGELNVGVHE